MTAIKKLINKLQTQNNNVLDNVFIGACEDIGFNRVFGGQVIAPMNTLSSTLLFWVCSLFISFFIAVMS
jgi:acyl-CoA thioesterase